MLYYKVSSFLRSENVFNYKDSDGKSVNVSVPGKLKRTDKSKICYISEAEYKGLCQKEHGGKPSAFSFLLSQAGDAGIIAEKVEFAKLPAGIQKKFNPKQHAKLEAARLRMLEKEAAKEK